MENETEVNNSNLHLENNNYYKEITKELEAELQIKKEEELHILDISLLEEITKAVPYIEKIFDKPKMFIKREEEVVNIEKMKKVTTDSIKDLAKHGDFVADYNAAEHKVRPEKMLNVNKEDTYNTYENRFIYSLVNLLVDILYLLEPKIEKLKDSAYQSFDYKANTKIEDERLDYIFNLKSTRKFSSEKNKKLLENFKYCKKYVKSWKQTEFYKTLVAERVIGIKGAVRRTNVILKNPNFQIAVKLWDFIHKYKIENMDNEDNNNVTLDDVDLIYRRRLENNFLSNYYIMKIYTSSSEEEKNYYEKLLSDLDYLLFKELEEYLNSKGYKTSNKEVESDHFDVVKTKKVNDASEIESKIKELTSNYLTKVNDYNFELRDEDEESI